MYYIENLYYGEKAEYNKLFTKWRLKMGKMPLNTYVLTLPRYGDGILEIRRFSALKHRYYRKYPLTVVGVAYGYREATMLAAKIVMEAYEESGSFDLKRLLGA